MRDLNTKEDRVLDEVKIKVDNTNRRYLFLGPVLQTETGQCRRAVLGDLGQSSRFVMKETMLSL